MFAVDNRLYLWLNGAGLAPGPAATIIAADASPNPEAPPVTMNVLSRSSICVRLRSMAPHDARR